MRPQPKRGQPVKEEEEVEYDHSQEIKKLLNDYLLNEVFLKE